MRQEKENQEEKMENKREMRKTLIQIIIYVVVMSVCENIFADSESQGWRVIPAALILAELIFSMAREKKLKAYGFCPSVSMNWGKTLFLLPMVILATINLWNGIAFRFEPVETVLYILGMLCVGFVEEILFRGYLLHTLMQNSARQAIIISSLTFGLGHIVNLLNGKDIYETLLQLIYAMAIGLMLSVFVVRTKQLLPCCIFHGVFNALAAFADRDGVTNTYQLVICIVITVIAVGYALWLWRSEGCCFPELMGKSANYKG